MDNQVNANSPVGATANGSATQEVSSTTQAVEPTKRSLRVQTWRKIQENNCGIGLNAIFNRIPGFVDSDKAVALLAGTDEFKKSQTIKVSIDRALQGAKLQALLDSKTLFLPGTRDSTALYLRVDVPDDATEERKKEILNVQDVQQNRTSISLDDKVTLDMIIIGSVLVSRDGYRIGRGNGFTDLDIGLLIEVGAITKDTIIATIVHDLQVVDNLPTSLFQKYDTPVDLIATPTEVIRVANRLPRPEGLFWELLSQRRLKIIPVLQILKERQEKDGKLIALKAEDTDVEQNQNNRNRRRIFKRRYGRKNTTRRAVSQTDTEHQGGDNAQQRRYPRRNKRFVNNRRRRPTKSEGDQSGVEVKSEERKPVADKRKPRIRRDRPANEFCVKLSNISRDVRVKDLKTELRKRKCNPFYINWKGQYGKCYLHFGQRNGSTAATDEEINKVLQLLADFSLTVTLGGGGNASGAEGDGAGSAAQPLNTKTVNVNVELVKFDAKPVAEPTKHSLRIQNWQKMQDKKIALDEKHIFNLIPGFLGSGKAATLASQTDEFKNAHNIGVHTGPSLHDIKLEVLLAGKSLFLPGARESSALCFRVDVPENFTDEQKKQILLNKDGQGRTEITVDNKVKLDMVFIGSVSVSRKGNRIGCGSDFTDLYMGLLIDVGLITSDTVIATLVHDVQVVKSLPECLFQKYDIPVDLIITPSQVIRVDRRDRPLGIFWDLLSEQHLKIMPILKLLKENQEKEGNVITLQATSESEQSIKTDVNVDHTAAAIIAEVNVDHTAAAINAEVNVDTSAAAAIIAEVNVDTTSAAGIINVVDTPVAAIIGDATSV